MKNHWIKRISIVLTALFLLAALPMLSMAEKDSGLRGKTATPSNLERVEENDEVEDEPDDEADEPEDELEEEIDGEEEPETVEDTVDTVSDNVVVSEAKKEAKTEAETKAAAPAAATPAPASAKISAEEIRGTWKADEVTSYRFDKDGKGALLLPKHKYAFTYTIKENELILKFENSRIGTKTFRVAVDGNQLTLERTGKEEFAPVTMQKAAG